jgi:integrase/recombinase XerD
MLLAFQNSREAPPQHEGAKATPLEAATARKELQILRTFFGFLLDHEHVEANYAKKLKPPREHRRPTLPFEQAEIDAMLTAASLLDDDNPAARQRTRAHARAAVLTMLYSGLRISDTATLQRSRVNLKDGRLLLRMEKTSEPVYVRLGQPAVDALRAMPRTGEYFFWSGESEAATVIGNLRRTIYRVCQKAGIEGHPHRFRDTFAVRMLANGVALEQVSILLGHTSIRTTEKYYAPWVRSRQKLLDQATAALDFVGAAPDTARRLRRVK